MGIHSKTKIMIENNVQLIGYVGADPIIKVFENGCRRTGIRVATHHLLKKEGLDKVYQTTWHDVVAWDKTVEQVENSFVIGTHILVEGMIEYSTFLDSTGKKRYMTQI